MRYRAVGFDVDGTLVINIGYCWEAFHERFGVSQKVRSLLRRRYEEGKITYEQWGQTEVGIWREMGVTYSDFVQVIRSFRLVDGAAEALGILRRGGLSLFVLSGTIRLVLELLLPQYRTIFDPVVVSDILFDEDERPVRFVPGQVLGMQRGDKGKELESLCEMMGLSPQEVAFVGDNENDVAALDLAGLGIAFCPRSRKAEEVADVTVKVPDLRAILPHIFGTPGEE